MARLEENYYFLSFFQKKNRKIAPIYHVSRETFWLPPGAETARLPEYMQYYPWAALFITFRSNLSVGFRRNRRARRAPVARLEEHCYFCVFFFI